MPFVVKKGSKDSLLHLRRHTCSSDGENQSLLTYAPARPLTAPEQKTARGSRVSVFLHHSCEIVIARFGYPLLHAVVRLAIAFKVEPVRVVRNIGLEFGLYSLLDELFGILPMRRISSEDQRATKYGQVWS